MKRRYVLGSMGAFTASGSLAVGSSASSSTEAARQTNVDVVGDEDAYLGFTYNRDVVHIEGGSMSVDVQCGSRVKLFDVINQLSTTLNSLTISLDDGRFRVCGSNEDSCSESLERPDLDCESGQCQEVWLEASDVCGETVEIDLQIEAEGDGFRISAVREFEVEVTPPGFVSLYAMYETQTSGRNDRIQTVEFQYKLEEYESIELDVEFEVDYRDGTESESGDSDPNQEHTVSFNFGGNEGGLPADLKARIEQGECYKLTLESGASSGSSNLLEEGISC